MTSWCISISRNRFQVFAVIFLFILIDAAQSAISEHSRRPLYSAEEQTALKQFRPLVNDTLYRDYMKEDLYLMKWLRASDYDLAKAAKMIRKAHQWRKTNKIDRITEEDWSTFEKAFPFFLHGQDLDGRPIGITHVAWDLRKAVLSGQGEKCNRNLIRMIELLDTKARSEFNGTIPSVANGTRDLADWVLISDLNGYSLRTHSCLQCVNIELRFAQELDFYYPSSYKTLYIVNMPRLYESIQRLVLSLVSQKTKDSFKVFGFDKAEYSAELLRNISPDQLLSTYGGTSVRSLD